MNFLIFSLMVLFKASICSSNSAESQNGNREVSACIHRYMEKDFLQIESIVYPQRKSQVLENCKKSYIDSNNNRNIMMDGQELEGSCKHLFNVKNCLTKELEKSREMGEFFVLRHLIYTINQILIWLCGERDKNTLGFNSTNIRSRFLVLLESIDCLECMRKSESYGCYTESIAKENFWNTILRLEQGPEICPYMKFQLNCFITSNSDIMKNICGSRAAQIYENLLTIFLENWCDKNFFQYTGASSLSSIPNNKVFFYLSLTLLYFFCK